LVFEGIGYQNLILPPGLAGPCAYNPDGVDFAQKIALAQTDGSTIYAIPIIYANHLGWTDEQNTFFAYLEFNLFQIEKQADGKWKVVVKEDGYSSTLNIQGQPDFFRQIKDNTGYIIYPDEVLADNFAFIMQERNGQKVTLKFSAEGRRVNGGIGGGFEGEIRQEYWIKRAVNVRSQPFFYPEPYNYCGLTLINSTSKIKVE